MANQYAYADEMFRRVVISDEELHAQGTYSSTANYVPRDTITYGAEQYIALISVSGTAPEGNHSDFWSTLALIGQAAPTGNYIVDGPATVMCHHLDWGTGSDQVNAGQMPYLAGGASLPTVEAALEKLFYQNTVITSFTNDVNTVEIGSTVTAVDLSWAYNKPVISQTLTVYSGPVMLDPSIGTYTDTGNFTQSFVYGLSATDGQTMANGNTAVTFANRYYWGTSTTPSPLTSAQIIALGNSQFASSRSLSVTVPSVGAYVYFAYPAAWGAATFTVNGLLNTAWVLTVVSFTNASGYTSDYNLYQSQNLLTGTYQIVVS
jgi:hypothetical protein